MSQKTLNNNDTSTKNNPRQVFHLPQSTLLEENDSLKLVNVAIATICSMIALFLVWASLTTISETATTYGEIVPLSPVQVIQHLEGGIISNVYVKDGQHVRAGQLLVKFDPTAARSELEKMEAREVSLLLDSERLRAYAIGNTSSFKDWIDKVKQSQTGSKNTNPALTRMLEDEKLLLNIQNTARQDQRSVLNSQLEQQKEQIETLKQQREILNKHVVLLEQEKKMYDELKQKEYFSQRDYLRVQREVNQAHGELHKIIIEEKKAQSELTESMNRLNQLNSNLSETANSDLGKVTSELFEVQSTIDKLRDRVKRLKIASPITGIVKGIEVNPGGVVPPGGKLLEIIPMDSDLLVETRISTKDIGHVKLGDPVKVKVMTYDYARYGDIDGKLTKISASTFVDEKKEPYYEGTVMLTKQYLGNDEKKFKLLPGMTVIADITTGQKTLLQYLLKPIHVTLSTSFHER